MTDITPMKLDKKFEEQILNDVRIDAFRTAIRFINYEMVPGSICEFGCYTGRSLAGLTYCHEKYYENENEHNKKGTSYRDIYGFDSFDGLSESEGHPRWRKGLFKTNRSFHPVMSYGEDVTPEKVISFFSHYELQLPIIKKGYFDELALDEIDQVALVHIDCDLYTSTKTALDLMLDKLAVGGLILFDDWYHFKGRKDKGERLAFQNFLRENNNIKCEEFLRYGTFCKAFIVVER